MLLPWLIEGIGMIRRWRSRRNAITRRHVAVGVVALAMVSACHAGKKWDIAYDLYRQSGDALRAGKAEIALQYINEAQTFYDDSRCKPRGGFKDCYFPHFRRAQILVRLQRYDEAWVEWNTEFSRKLIRRNVEFREFEPLGEIIKPNIWIPPEPPQQDIWAVVVGVNAYDVNDPLVALAPTEEDTRREGFSRIPLADLVGAVPDALAVYRYLVDVAKVPKSNIKLLADGMEGESIPNLENTRKALEWLSSHKGQQALFYFAGHGLESFFGDNLLLVKDTQMWEWTEKREQATAIEATAVRMQEVYEKLMKADFLQRIAIIDACRINPYGRIQATSSNTTTDPATRGYGTRGVKVGGGIPTADEDSRNPRIIVYGTFSGGLAEELRAQQRGCFTFHFVRALEMAIPVTRLQGWLDEQMGPACGQQKPSVHILEGTDVEDIKTMRIAGPARVPK